MERWNIAELTQYTNCILLYFFSIWSHFRVKHKYALFRSLLSFFTLLSQFWTLVSVPRDHGTEALLGVTSWSLFQSHLLPQRQPVRVTVDVPPPPSLCDRIFCYEILAPDTMWFRLTLYSQQFSCLTFLIYLFLLKMTYVKARKIEKCILLI